MAGGKTQYKNTGVVMFIGAINHKVRKFLLDNKHIFTGHRICVGCSGNFTFEKIISGEAAYIWSNDISVYSSAIGYALTKRPFSLKIQESRYSQYNKYLNNEISKIAVVALFFEMLKFEKQENIFQKRMFAYYTQNFQYLFERTCERIKNALSTLHINKYTTIDVYDLFQRLSPNWTFIVFLPTYVGGYEKLYNRLEQIFEWPKPKYEILDQARYEQTINFMRKGRFLYMTDYERKEAEDLVARIKTSRLKEVFIYSNLYKKKIWIRPLTNYEKKKYRFLPLDYQISDNNTIKIVETTNTIMNYYKNLFLKKGIDYTSGSYCLLFFIDDFLFGFAIFMEMQKELKAIPKYKSIYLLSDFVINSSIPKLSKLLLFLLRTTEVAEILKKKYHKDVNYIVTTVFTQKPVSMKYRGIFKLYKRDEEFLQYIAKTKKWSIKEALKNWCQRFPKNSKK
ncbi:MAG TPA: hypothetical protein ENI51_02055 [Candidatus Atribacteria bacterium]|nr:hypothetical protein [Candidatus Atribacteria bacterium]